MITSKLPEHLMVSESDGHLYDTRKPGWHKLPPLRSDYRNSFREIKTTAQLKASLRTKYAWPGGYEIVYFTSDGALLCHDCTVKHLRNVLWSIHNKCSDGWRIIGSGYEAISFDCTDADHSSQCDHCGKDFGEIC